MVDADQGNSTFVARSLCTGWLDHSWLTRTVHSAHSHHIPAAPGRRLESSNPPHLHSGTAVYAGKDYKVRSESQSHPLEAQADNLVALWPTQKPFYQ